MANETSTKDMLVAIREKIKTLIEEDTTIALKKVYKGTPNSIPNYAVVMLDWTDDEPGQVVKGQFKILQSLSMSIIVIEKSLNYDERQDRLLTLTGKIKKLMVTNRYLNGLRAENGDWKVQDVKLAGTNYEALVKPKTFVLDSSEIKILIVTEGI